MRKTLRSFSFAIILLALTASGCGSAAQAPEPAEAEGTAEVSEPSGWRDDAASNSKYAEPVEMVTPEYAKGEELLCLCDSEEEAQKIADLYGIKLVKFGFGVATFHAEDPMSVIALGKEKGYPELELNGISSIFDN